MIFDNFYKNRHLMQEFEDIEQTKMNTNNTDSVVHYYDPERLYLLAEDNNEVYVDNFLMEQHQIDGLRFLFAQFNKKSPGVIVNFPPSCGKSATVAIFLNAVTNILKNPVLILCKDDSEVQYWKEILLKWSSYVESDIAVESSNPFIKGKKFFVKKRENLYSYQRRRWSIIIIKENAISKEIFKLVFEADFKICITATDIKKDVSLLTAVYKWLYPKRKVNINDFVAKENCPKEKFRKSVQLDLILEDVAVRRYLNLKPFQITENADNITEIETEVEANDRKGSLKNKDATGIKVKRTKKPKDDIISITTVNDDAVNELSGQAFIFINDDKILDQNVNTNSIIINDQLVNNTSDQNIILMNDHTKNEVDQNYILVNDVVNETSNHNFILINDGQMLNQGSNQNFILMNEPSNEILLMKDQTVTETSKQNDILRNEHNISKNCDNNFILIDDDDELIINHTKETEDCNIISDAHLPLLNENDDFVIDDTNDFSINSYNNNRDKVNKSPIHKVINHLDSCDDNDSFKLDVESFIRDEQPVNRSGRPSRLCNEAESKTKSKFPESLVIDNDSKVDLNEMKYLDNKDLLKEQLIESLHLDESSANLKEIKELEKSAIKEESTEAVSSHIENNSKLDLNEIKDLRSQLIESLGLDSDCKVVRHDIKHTENKNNSKVDPNEMKDIRNKCLLQKQLIESLGFSSDCQKSFSENKTTELNECKDFEEIKEESTESLSLVSNSKVDQNKIRDLETNLIKEESIESLNFCSNSKVDRNETKDLHNKNLLQQQLIESLNLNDVKDEIKDEESDDPNGSDEKMNNNKLPIKSQIAADKDDEVIVIKVEPEDGNVSITERNLNNISKRKSDVSDKDLDDKILEMEERALKKFKGSFLDSIF